MAARILIIDEDSQLYGLAVSGLDQTLAFNMGADNFLARPFSLPLLQQRISMLLRARPQEPSEMRNGHGTLERHGIELNRTWRSVTVSVQLVELTPTEFEILWTLLAQPGRPFTRSELLTSARGVNAEALARTIDVHVRALRQKIGARGSVIETVRGIGDRAARKT